MSAVRAQKSPRSDRALIAEQHRAILQALDKQYEYEVPNGSSKPTLRLVRPGEVVNHNHAG
jgi:hypothetical protein